MADARRFSRTRHSIKLNSREALEQCLKSSIYRTLRDHDPTALPGTVEVISELTAVIASQLVSQTQATQRALRTMKVEVADYGTEFVGQLVQEARKDVASRVKRTAVAPSTTGVGIVLADDWAGPVAGPTLIERNFGIPRSTLYRWQKRSEVVWLNTRTSKKPVFPLRQFVDGHPAEGIAELVQVLGDPRTAWQWLVTPHSEFEGTAPLEILLAGDAAAVVRAAQKK